MFLKLSDIPNTYINSDQIRFIRVVKTYFKDDEWELLAFLDNNLDGYGRLLGRYYSEEKAIEAQNKLLEKLNGGAYSWQQN
jgi:hypothetical protein